MAPEAIDTAIANTVGFERDFYSDLNAMNAAEKFAAENLMDADQWEAYGRSLVAAHPTACLFKEGCGPTGEIDYHDLATLMCGLSAAQRAEAFLRTLNLWTE